MYANTTQTHICRRKFVRTHRAHATEPCPCLFLRWDIHTHMHTNQSLLLLLFINHQHMTHTAHTTEVSELCPCLLLRWHIRTHMHTNDPHSTQHTRVNYVRVRFFAGAGSSSSAHTIINHQNEYQVQFENAKCKFSTANMCLALCPQWISKLERDTWDINAVQNMANHTYCHSHNNWGPRNSFQRFLVPVYYWKTVGKTWNWPSNQLLWEWQYEYICHKKQLRIIHHQFENTKCKLSTANMCFALCPQ
jgi:hypothetical protein